MMPDLAETVAAIIDAPAWSDRAALRASGRKVLSESDRTRKMDGARRASSLKKARQIIREVGDCLIRAANHSAPADGGTDA